MITANDSKSPLGQDLLDNLEVNLKLSQDLLSALHEESAALRGMDTQGLFRISRQKDTLLAKIHYLDDTLKASLVETDKTPSADLTPENSRIIRQYKTKINGLRQEIQARNMINKRFTEDTLGYLSDAIALLSSPTVTENTYRVPGRAHLKNKNLPSFISREV